MTEDGAETDLDLGHYERYTSLTRRAKTTSRPDLSPVITKERPGRLFKRNGPGGAHVTI